MHVSNDEVHSDHDQMHRSGLSEKRARKIKRNDWVNTTCKDIATAFNDHNYGQKYEELKAVYEYKSHMIYHTASLMYVEK